MSYIVTTVNNKICGTNYSTTVELTDTIIRPSNTTQYSINDVINNSTSNIQGLSMGNDHYGSMIKISEITLTSSANQSTKPQVTIYLWNETPSSSSVFTDNAVLSLTAAEARKCIASIPLTRSVDLNSCFMLQSDLALPIVFEFKSEIYFVLQVNNAYTPVSGESFYLNVFGELI